MYSNLYGKQDVQYISGNLSFNIHTTKKSFIFLFRPLMLKGQISIVFHYNLHHSFIFDLYGLWKLILPALW